MKHIDFSDLLKNIKEIEIIELRDAIKAHGGKYEWPEHTGPVVLAEDDLVAEIFVVEAVELKDYDSIEITGHWRDEFGRLPKGPVYIWAEDSVVVGDISLITGQIQEPDAFQL